MSPSTGVDASAQSPQGDKTVDRVVQSKRKVYRNGLQKGDLKVPLCGFGGVKCKCVCFFA